MKLPWFARQLTLVATIFAAALLLYLRTLVPGVFVSDFVEFQYQPLRLGLPHPNGFPLYMLLGWLWSHLPIGSVAWRMNALSAVGGALAVSVTAAFAYRLSKRAAVALLAGGLLLVSPTFWYYSLAAERYTLNLALLAGAWWTAWESAQRKPVWPAILSALLLSLGLAMHPSDALMIPFWLGYLVWRRPESRRQVRFWLALALAGVAPLLLFAYVPARWAAFSNWPLLGSIDRSSAIYQGMVHVWYERGLRFDLISRYILGLGGYAASLAAGGWQQALRNMWEVAPYWLRDAPWPLLGAALVGAVALWRLERALTLALAGFSGLVILMVAYITQGKNDAYLLPAFWTVFFCAAFALHLLMDGLPALAARLVGRKPTSRSLAWLSGGALLLVVVLLFGMVLRRYPAADLSRSIESRLTWEINLKHPLEEGAGLLGHWSDLTPLWYTQQIEERRTDLVGLFPPDMGTVIGPWLHADRPLYLAAPLQEWALDLPGRYDLVSWGRLVRIQPRGTSVACPSLSKEAETPAAWPFAVSRWEVDEVLGDERRGDEAPGLLRFCWQARTALPRETFLRVRLRPLDGGSELQFNEPLISTWYPAPRVGEGAQGLAIVPLRVPLGAAPGRYVVDMAPYLLREEGATGWPDVAPISLGEVTVAPSRVFEVTRLTDETAPILPPRAGPLTLRAWRVSREAVRPGDPVRVELLWEMGEAPNAPITVSLGFRDAADGRVDGSPQIEPLTIPVEAGGAGRLVRTVHNVKAPRGRGDHLYLVEPRVQLGDRWLDWWPTFRLAVGTMQVRDRTHSAALPASASPIQAAFGQHAELAGQAPLPAHLAPGQPLPVTLYWRARAETDRSYAVFLHLVDEQGRLVAQRDSIPVEGSLPMNLWLPGEIISDTHALALPATLLPGRYTLRLGLYDPASGERLPISSERPITDRALQLATFEVAP